MYTPAGRMESWMVLYRMTKSTRGEVWASGDAQRRFESALSLSLANRAPTPSVRCSSPACSSKENREVHGELPDAQRLTRYIPRAGSGEPWPCDMRRHRNRRDRKPCTMRRGSARGRCGTPARSNAQRWRSQLVLNLLVA